MMKFVGGLCILIGMIGYGKDYNRNIRVSYRRLILWKEYLLKMESEMVHLRKPLPGDPFGTERIRRASVWNIF